MAPVDPALPPANSTRRVLIASLAGTTIEFFDFYIYATAAVLVFPKLFFPKADPAAAVLESLATFAIAFFARPVGSAVFGHFGDRIGRKATLVASLVTMGLSTVTIGLLPTYATLGAIAPLLLALCRFGQGFGLGGEWGGAVLLATENAPAGRRAWFGMFPQLGAPLGFLLSGATFLLLSSALTNDQFLAFGWRLPFIASSLLVFVGLYVRLKITETPAFQRTLETRRRVAVPFFALCRHHGRALVLGTVTAIVAFVLFYLLTVFCLSWGTSHLGYSRNELLLMQTVGVLFFALAIPISAVLADRLGRRLTMITVSGFIILFGLVLAPLFQAGAVGVFAGFVIGFILIGAIYGPLGTLLSEFFPTEVRYTGSSIAFNLAGIFGASLAPYVATKLATNYGLSSVGYYLSAAAALSLIALFFSHETRDAAYGTD
jgi:metabolite-proton symporter